MSGHYVTVMKFTSIYVKYRVVPVLAFLGIVFALSSEGENLTTWKNQDKPKNGEDLATKSHGILKD